MCSKADPAHLQDRIYTGYSSGSRSPCVDILQKLTRLRRWGVADRLAKTGAVAIEGTSIRRGATDEELASASYAAVVERFQAPIWASP